MPRYFFDLTGEGINYRDTDGSELPNVELARAEAVGFLAAIFGDISFNSSESELVVSVRNAADRVIFRTMLSLRSDWVDTADIEVANDKRPVVLLVEDEFLSRASAAETIGDAGFEVIEACNADEAIAILEVRRDIQIVFTDIRMPGLMDGLKLARYISGKWPPTKIIATSGHLVAREGDLPAGGLFLQKPYTPDALTRALLSFTGTAQ